MKNVETNLVKENDKYGLWSYISFGFGDWAMEMANNAFGSLYFFFYETELLLKVGFILAANIIFAIYNAINDPLIGFFTEKPNRLTKKYGIRFPWMLIAVIPMYISYILLFTPPQNAGQWTLFFWLVVFLCICDTMYSLFYVHFKGMFTEKYTSKMERNKGTTYSTLLAMVGMSIGILLPVTIYKFNDPHSYSVMALVIGIIGMACAFLLIPGSKPTAEMLERERHAIAQQAEIPSFKVQIKNAFSNRNYLAYVQWYFFIMVFDLFVFGTLPYFIKWILGISPDDAIMIYAMTLVGFIISIPIANQIAKRNNFRNTLLISAVLKIIPIFAFTFVSSLNGAIVLAALNAIGSGCVWFCMAPNMSEALDDMVIKTKNREKGPYVGLITFSGRLAIILYSVAVTITHKLTNFIADAPVGAEMQPLEAQWGIRILLGIVPSVAVTIAAIWFARWNEMKGDRASEIKNEIKALGLY